MAELTELIKSLMDETRRNTTETRKTNDRLLKLNTQLKTRNEIDQQTLLWNRRTIIFLIIVVCMFAGLNVGKLAGFIP